MLGQYLERQKRIRVKNTDLRSYIAWIQMPDLLFTSDVMLSKSLDKNSSWGLEYSNMQNM